MDLDPLCGWGGGGLALHNRGLAEGRSVQRKRMVLLAPHLRHTDERAAMKMAAVAQGFDLHPQGFVLHPHKAYVFC